MPRTVQNTPQKLGIEREIRSFLTNKGSNSNYSRIPTDNEKQTEKNLVTWRGGRVAECTGLLNRQARKGLGGSNPPLSALQ